MVQESQFSPDVRLQQDERALLVLMASTEGYKIMHRIFRSEVDKFVVDLINADPAKPGEVLAKHKIAKAAAQFHEAAFRRINEEVIQYTTAARESDEPRDDTEGILDIGNLASTLHDLEEESLGEELI